MFQEVVRGFEKFWEVWRGWEVFRCFWLWLPIAYLFEYLLRTFEYFWTLEDVSRCFNMFLDFPYCLDWHNIDTRLDIRLTQDWHKFGQCCKWNKLSWAKIDHHWISRCCIHLHSFQDASSHLHTFQDISICFKDVLKMFPDGFQMFYRCYMMLQDVSGCLQMFPDVVWPPIAYLLKMFQDVWSFLIHLDPSWSSNSLLAVMFEDVSGCVRMFDPYWSILILQ